MVDRWAKVIVVRRRVTHIRLECTDDTAGWSITQLKLCCALMTWLAVAITINAGDARLCTLCKGLLLPVSDASATSLGGTGPLSLSFPVVERQTVANQQGLRNADG